MRRFKTILIRWGLGLGGLALLGALLFPIFARSRENHHRSCSYNLKYIALGFKQYTQDYDEKYPLTSISPTEGWVDVLQPYLKSRQIFQCPNVEDKNTKIEHCTDYFYNARLAGRAEYDIDVVNFTLELGDGFDNAGTNAALWELPFDWVSNPDSPAHRHQLYPPIPGANYAYVDGHVKWLKPEQATANSSRDGHTTFALE